eukprot:384409_1
MGPPPRRNDLANLPISLHFFNRRRQFAGQFALQAGMLIHLWSELTTGQLEIIVSQLKQQNVWVAVVVDQTYSIDGPSHSFFFVIVFHSLKTLCNRSVFIREWSLFAE